MKRNTIPKSALALLIIGLLITTLTPVINSSFPMPDYVKGFLVGLGLMLEVIALIKIQQNRKNIKCV